MLVSCNASANPEGSVSMVYKKDEVYHMSAEWQKKVASGLVQNDLAMEVKAQDMEVKAEVKEDVKPTKSKTTKKAKVKK